MLLPDARLSEVQIGMIGTPWDSGTTYRPGPRHGPRQMRDTSTMIRAEHGATGTRPFELANCADLGDVAPNPADLIDSMDQITDFYRRIKEAEVLPLAAGGNHRCTLPLLRALAAERPLGLIRYDSHTDLFHSYFGGTMYTHGTPFRRAVEEGLLDPRRMVQIGIRGTTYDRKDRDFAKSEGIRLIEIEELRARGVGDVMTEARDSVGADAAYVAYDMGFVDPAFAPGAGAPEVGGPNSFQALQVARMLRASVSLARIWWRFRRHSMRAEGRPISASQSCSRCFA